MTFIVEIVDEFSLEGLDASHASEVVICMQEKPNDFNDESHATHATPTERRSALHAPSFP